MGTLPKKPRHFGRRAGPDLVRGKPQAGDAQSRVEPSRTSGEFCSKSAASNPLICSASISYNCISTPGFWHPDRFSETSTLAYKFGEIADVPRRQAQPSARPSAERRPPDPARCSGDYHVASRSVRIAPLWIPDLVAATRRDALGYRG